MTSDGNDTPRGECTQKRLAAVQALDPHHEADLDRLEAYALSDPDYAVRSAAVERVLGAEGTPPLELVEVLACCAHYHLQPAAWHLIARHHPEALELLTSRLRWAAAVRVEVELGPVAEALVSLGEPGITALLERLLSDAYPGRMDAPLAALVRAGPLGTRALRRLAMEGPPSSRLDAFLVLAQEGKDELELALELLHLPSTNAQQRVCQALASFEPFPANALLEVARGDGHHDLRATACEILLAFSQSPAASAEEVEQIGSTMWILVTTDASRAVQIAAFEACRALGRLQPHPDAPQVCLELFAAFRQREYHCIWDDKEDPLAQELGRQLQRWLHHGQEPEQLDRIIEHCMSSYSLGQYHSGNARVSSLLVAVGDRAFDAVLEHIEQAESDRQREDALGLLHAWPPQPERWLRARSVLMEAAEKTEEQRTLFPLCRLLLRYTPHSTPELIQVARTVEGSWVYGQAWAQLLQIGSKAEPLLERAMSDQGELAAHDLLTCLPLSLGLLEQLTDRHGSGWLEESQLERIAQHGPATAPLLWRLATRSDEALASRALDHLAGLEPRPIELISDLAARHRRKPVRQRALACLGEVGTPAAPELFDRLLRGPDHERAALLLAGIGEGARLEVLAGQHGSAEIRRACILAIGSGASPDQLLAWILRDPHDGNRALAMHALETRGRRAIGHLRILAFSSEAPGLAPEATQALLDAIADLSSAALLERDLVPVLLDIAQRPHIHPRHRALDILLKQGPGLVDALADQARQRPAQWEILELLARLDGRADAILEELLASREDPRAAQAVRTGRSATDWGTIERLLEDAAADGSEQALARLTEPLGYSRGQTARERGELLEAAWADGRTAAQDGRPLLVFLYHQLRSYAPGSDTLAQLAAQALLEPCDELLPELSWRVYSNGPLPQRELLLAGIAAVGAARGALRDRASSILSELGDARPVLQRQAEAAVAMLAEHRAGQEPPEPLEEPPGGDLNDAARKLAWRYRHLDGWRSRYPPRRKLRHSQWRDIARALRMGTRGDRLWARLGRAENHEDLERVARSARVVADKGKKHAGPSFPLDRGPDSGEAEIWDEHREHLREQLVLEQLRETEQAQSDPEPMEPPTLAPAAGPTLASLDLPAARWGGVLQAPKGPEEQAAAPDDDDLAAPPPTPREARALLRDTLARAKSEPAEDESIRALIQLVDGLPAAIDSYTRATLHAAMPRLHPSWLPCVRLLTLEGGLDRLLGRRGAALDRSSLTCWLQALPAPDPLLSHRLAAPVHKVLAYGGGSAWNQDYTSFTLLARPTLAGTLLEYREALQGHLALLNRLTGLLAPGGSLRELLEALLEPPYWGVERLLPDSDGERSLVAFERRVERHVNKGRAPSSVGTGGSGQVLDGVAHAIHAMWKAERGLWRSGWATALRETALLRHHLNSEQVAQDDHRSIARHLLGCLQQGPGELAALLNLPEGRPDPLGPRVRRCRLEEQIEETLRESLGADGRRDRVLPGRRLCFEPQDKLRALRERPTDEDEHTVSDTLRILSPHLVRYAIHDDEGRLSGSLCLVEAWASPEDPAEANPHARLPVLCLEQLRSTDLHLYALRLDLLHALQRLAEARGLVGLVLVSDSSAWCHPSELELDALHANRRGIPVTLEPADPASWRCLERAAGGRPLHPSCVFRSCARGGGSGVLLAPLDAPGHALHPENLTELDRLAQQMGPGLTITAGSREHPQGFISGLPRPPRS